MRGTTCVLLLCVTCIYWVLAVLILLLRVVDPHMRGLVRYGGRHGKGSTAADGDNNNNIAAAGKRAGVHVVCKDRVSPTEHRGWLWNGVTVAVRALEGSMLCRVRVGRKCGFCAFYLTGIVSAFLLWQTWASSRVAASCYESLPLAAFFIHCAVRLWECLQVHRFRGGPQDTVTLFAALAGCSFYVFAVISSSPVICSVARAVAEKPAASRVLGSVAGSRSFPVVPVTTVGAFLLHLLLQRLQGLHHGILARLRGAPRASSASFEAPISGRKRHADEVCSGVEASAAASGSFYRFPNACLFAYVLEPHYACEILMYVVNAVSLWTLTSHDAASMLEVWRSKGAYGTLLLAASYATPLGVLLFSLFNLAMTASEHRLFWNQLNARRERKESVPPWNLFYRVW
ncbi:oxidoreductase [Trypanosoma conorhini]|uniref:Oxidoreductase n=1 Tax=Trypanosoma conorhini TaxID=83891 RepID=A0A422Q7F7_9TRYP|nr:oxidoreductase [Trypanosoma conorhini]RNF25891.1 oxidoreductase [Trypanosoma conorhini]